ncbi:MAG: hypothetical protein IPJ34_03190 [Myxococcales bacterium]|nr:hypothetical protein [Myxococcales bacterium]
MKSPSWPTTIVGFQPPPKLLETSTRWLAVSATATQFSVPGTSATEVANAAAVGVCSVSWAGWGSPWLGRLALTDDCPYSPENPQLPLETDKRSARCASRSETRT